MATRGAQASDPAGATGDYLPIREYAVIGNCRTAALVGTNGSIDWYCPGRFDAPAVLSRILDAHRGGYLSLHPEGEWTAQRRYLDETNVLVATYRSGDGEVRVTDYMPMGASGAQGQAADEPGKPTILRRMDCIHGEATIRLRYRPGWDYGLTRPEVECVPGRGVIARCGEEYLGLACPDFELAEGDGIWEGVLRLSAGEHQSVAFDHTPDHEAALRALNEQLDENDLSRTVSFWRTWARRCSYSGPYRDAVVRSALTLKLLTYNPTGALVAAPTTSLPEEIGGERNWDYRFTWLRDSGLILYSLLTVNYHHEAVRFLHWLEGVMTARPREVPQIMYTIEGGRDLTERELTDLEGYCGSRPVRVGNAAAKQVQLDIYGEVLTAAYVHYHRPDDSPTLGDAQGRTPDRGAWEAVRTLVDDAIEHWEEPDNGIWEVRGGPRQFLYSKLM